MSLATEADANRKTALNQLKFRKTHRDPHAGGQRSTHPSPTSATVHPPAHSSPPLQSRDATVQSRFFPAPSHNLGNVLVPSSSPPHPDTSYRPHQPYNNHYRANDVAHNSGVVQSSPWSHTNGHRPADPLALPSGFVNNTGVSHASFSRSLGGTSRGISQVDGAGEVEPPRKRLHVGSPSHDPIDLFNLPPSPEVVRPGPKRKRVVHSSESSDEDMPDVRDILNGPKKRIMRGQPQERQPSEAPLSEQEDNQLRKFTLTMPEHRPPRVRAAWLEAGKDVRKATALLQDRTWSPKVTIKPTPVVTGRVKEIDEAHRADKAAVREKAKKSAIYANRPILEIPPKNPPASPSTSRVMNASIDLTMSPGSPAVAARRTKRAKKKMVVHSDSEFADSDNESSRRPKRPVEDVSDEARALKYFNTADKEALQELTGCSPEQASKIIELRPFESSDDLKSRLSQGKKKGGPAGISRRMFDDCTQIFAGYGAVDSILEDCERIGAQLKTAIASWTSPSPKGKEKAQSGSSSRGSSVLTLGEDVAEDGALSLRSFGNSNSQKSADYLIKQPSLLPDGVQLKEYQLLGVNWLSLLFRKQLSCILADEMGLGKTIQVISFFAHLKEQGNKGPHLIVVPSSTLENWCREFARFAPAISVQTYYAGKDERPMLRQTLTETQRKKHDDGWEVLITTYNLAQGDERDRKFFRRIEWETCVFDEGHVLKNFQSQRYQALLKYGSKWRLLLTGTPLQNNLQELVSLMNFILPEHFADALDDLRAIFKAKGDSKVTLLAQERVSRAKKMMTPFVLRRRKDQVLKDLPKKTERIEWCEMTPLQKSIYDDALQRSRKTIFDVVEPAAADETPSTGPKGKPAKKTRANARPKDKLYLENSSNVLMDLRKAASHPMLFRRRFTDEILTSIAEVLLREPDYRRRGAEQQFVEEDMSVMTDAELQVFVATYKSTRKFLLKDTCHLEAGKIKVLLKLLDDYKAQGRRVLVFSQFTQILDIVQAVLKHRKTKYLVLTGSTAVDVRQSLVDEFTEDESISVFLLSTKAGGMGINLTAASVVIMFDQDFNPHNDRQAQDRAYRIGQRRDVDVVKLITRGTIEEDMLRLGQTKLALDEAVAGDAADDGDKEVVEKEVKTSLMNVLRNKFVKEKKEQGQDGSGADPQVVEASAAGMDVEDN